MIASTCAWVALWERSRPLTVLCTLLACAALEASAADAIVGMAHVHDGDSITIGGTKIRLEGIDAPEVEQFCLAGSGAEWRCGLTARDRLRAKLGMATVKCEPEGRDRYGRTLAICSAGNVEINGWLVREGWALSFVRYGDRYRVQEDDARAHERGLWSGAFIAPWAWRRRDERTEILGARKVPIDAQPILLKP